MNTTISVDGWKKSAIQVAAEIMNAKYHFSQDIQKVQEKYQVPNYVFRCHPSDGRAVDVNTGLYLEKARYSTLEEAVENLDILSQGLRVYQDGNEYHYAIGDLFSSYAQMIPHRQAGQIWADLSEGQLYRTDDDSQEEE